MDRKKNLETCLVIVTGLLIIFLINDWVPLLIAAIIIGLTGVFLNKAASWITWFWYKIADILGKIVPKVILSIVFFIFLFPVSMLSRLFIKNKPGVNERNSNSMWISREYIFNKDDLKNPW
jgi:hypothetical protein